MIKSILLIVALAALTWAEEETHEDWVKLCGPLERLKVKQQWNDVYGVGLHRLDFGLKIFERLFDQHPEYRKLMPGADNIYAPKFLATTAEILGNLDTAFSLMDNDEAILDFLSHIKKGPHSTPEHYRMRVEFGNAMAMELPQILGRDHFDYKSWQACYMAIVTLTADAGEKPE